MIESSSLEVISQLVVAAMGYGILPERVIAALGKEEVQRHPGSPAFQDQICLVYKPSFRKTKRGQVFLEAVKSGHQNGPLRE